MRGLNDTSDLSRGKCKTRGPVVFREDDNKAVIGEVHRLMRRGFSKQQIQAIFLARGLNVEWPEAESEQGSG